jgi:opacity protein-like surface antigen
MKKFLIAAVTILSLSGINNVQAQQGFSFSVKAAPQMSWLQNQNDNDNSQLDIKPLFGSSFGLGAGYNFTPNLGIGLDVLYSMQGSKYEANGAEFKQKVDYVKVPLLFTYTSNPSAMVSFFSKVGPQLSFLTNSKLTNGDGDKIIEDMNERYEKVTFGGVANAGAQFRLSQNIFLTTGLRFDYDFTNAEDKNYNLYPAGREATHNMTAGLEVGLKYKL